MLYRRNRLDRASGLPTANAVDMIDDYHDYVAVHCLPERTRVS